MPSKRREMAFGSLLLVPTRNGIHKGPASQGRGVPVVKMGEVYHADIVKDAERDLLDLTPDELNRLEVLVDDLLFCRTSLVAEGVGHCALVGELSQRTTFASNLIRVRLDQDKADPRYWFYYFRSPMGQEQLLTLARGTSVTTITGPDIAALDVPVSDISAQRSIARILGALDDKIELNRKMNETLEQMARAIFKSWFVDFEPFRDKGMIDSPLGNIPKGWEAKRLIEVVEVNPTRPMRRGTVAAYLDMQNMPTSGHGPLGWIERPFGSGTRFVNGDTLLARITPCLENGKTSFVDFLPSGQTGWGSTEYIVLRPRPPFPPEYGYLLARDESFREHAIQNMTGSSGRQRVPPESLDDYLLPKPPGGIAEEFGRVVAPLFASARANDDQSRTLAAIRDALLPRLLSGEIDIRS